MRVRWTRLLILVALGAAIVVYFTSGEGEVSIEPGSTLVIEVGGEYVEAKSPSLVQRLMGERARPFAGLLSMFALAERDDRLGAVVIHIRSSNLGWGKANEVRAAIARVRDAGHKTVAYVDVGSFSANKEYFVATAADEIYLMPGAILPLVGLAAEYVYLGGLWELIGIDLEYAKVGKYKSAVETLAETQMSDATREMADSILDSIEGQFVAGIAAGRDLTAQQVRAAIDRGPIRPEEFVELELIDGIAHLDSLAEMQGEVVPNEVYAGIDPASVGFDPQASFALVYGTGMVVSGGGSVSRTGGQVFAADAVGTALKDAAEDPEIDAIVFRIDSPGGSSVASEQIWRALEIAKQSGKPIVASLSDVAASGGYYAIAGTDGIVAPPGTITGSIGVYALRPALGGLLDKLGIQVESMTRGRHADFLLSSQPLSPGARERLEQSVERTYALFVERVAAGREMEPEAVDAVAQGRVWTGEQALEQGLVDELGGLRIAARRAKRALGMSDDTDVILIPYPPSGGLADELRELLSGGLADAFDARASARLLAHLPLPTVLADLVERLRDLAVQGPVSVPPLWIEIQ